MDKIPLYNGLGFCEVNEHLGDDWSVVKAARQSYTDSLKGEEADTKLLRYLMKNRHTSPFEHCNITFGIRMPIFVMRQFVRHRTFRLNEESARYKEMRDDFYVPTEWRVQNTEGNKQGSEFKESSFNHEDITGAVNEMCRNTYALYKSMLDVGVAKEQARLVLPVNLMTQITVNIDLHNLMHFFRLRLDSHAQWEIRCLASAMFYHFEELYPVTAKAFKDLVLDPNDVFVIAHEELDLY